ncbi:MAG: carotenoid 1,2-hydratase [Desulfobacterales bacterium]|jgi:predicted secreted hydrolase|nr:carotenoid 1,2-hydratase [Desulfobacterales bacterium]
MNMMCYTKKSIFFFLCIFTFTHAWGFAEDSKGYLSVTGPCHLEFPKDHGSHPGYRTEWWYFTGNLQSSAGNRYGFQLTFFRRRINPIGSEKKWPKPASAWRTSQIYLAHAALSDLNGKRHYYDQCMGRGGLGIAGVSRDHDSARIFVEKWSARISPKAIRLKAVAEKFSFHLDLTPLKPLAVHGNKGYSRKGSTPERASCYYSLTRLETNGQVMLAGKTFAVKGLSWMDHEFSTSPLEPGIIGWDWFGLQLSDNTEIMIYLLRQKDGRWHPASSGTYVRSDGTTRHLSVHDIESMVLDTWKSPNSGAVYPARWRIRILSPAMDLYVSSNLADQEMRTRESTGVNYWEGSVSVRGNKNGRRVDGQGYMELTGYAKPFEAPL